MLVIIYEGESIQPYYCHKHDIADNEYQRAKFQKFLEKRKNNIDFLTLFLIKETLIVHHLPTFS